ncbi:hypothetical protein TL16_g07121 [Triparma laevis f. inornata]|uniref:WW domain-containing protein n=1 Tax=Triparma laevis f. inornata TaxID=1714386 RepID=A0A9W7EFZ1_9STRA|nr:hypothetical protein TL16_g07121 [Triparma laevis f. inornata]
MPPPASPQKNDSEAVDDWLAYKNEEEKMYFYNEKTGGNVWELPHGVDRYIDMDDGERLVILGECGGEGVESVEEEVKLVDSKKEAGAEGVQVDPVTVAMEFLEGKDAVLEPNCMKHVAVAREGGGNQADILKTLVKGYCNVPGEIGIMAGWLKELEGDTEQHKKIVKDSVTTSIEACLKENFSEDEAQQILEMEGSELGWVGEMLKNEDWMRMLIRLQKNNKDSALLTYFLTQISKLGHHHLLLNQTDNFLVFNNMLEHMLLKLAKAKTTGEGDETLGVLRKICLSMPHVFWYSRCQLKSLLEDESCPEEAKEKFQTLYDELNLAAQTGDIDLVKFTPSFEGNGAEAEIVKAVRESWAAGVGTMIWAKLFSSEEVFLEGTQYPTFVPGLLELTRLVAGLWPGECAPACFDLVAGIFLQKPPLGGGKDGSSGCTEKQNRGIKEQCLRLMLFLMPWVGSLVLKFLTEEGEKGAISNFDESLIRYYFGLFVGSYGGVAGFESAFVGGIKRLLRTPNCSVALSRGAAATTKAKLKNMLNAKPV